MQLSEKQILMFYSSVRDYIYVFETRREEVDHEPKKSYGLKEMKVFVTPI